MLDDLPLTITADLAAAARELVASLERAFNDHDALAISRHFADEAAWATVMGLELAGRAEIEAFGRSVMSQLAKSYARYEVTRLLPVGPNAVAVRVLQRPVDEHGRETDERKGAGLYVIARRDGGWKIVAGQITFVGEHPDRVERAADDISDAALERGAVEQVVARLQHAQQNELVDEFIDLFHEDATWVTGGGRRLLGRDAIAEFTREVLPGAMTHSTAVYEVVHVNFVRPDVAVVAVRQRPISLDGRPLDNSPEGRPTYVMSKDSAGAWRIAHGQNTQQA
jgi:uncharacterized protein (TIGR02246 family)